MMSRSLTSEQKRQSRIKQTRDAILSRGLCGLLNNTKWSKIFEWMEESRLEFEIKLLSETNPRYGDFVKELMDNAVLVDNSGDFVEFLEIESLTIKNNREAIDFLNSLGVEYLGKTETLTIPGYRGKIPAR